LGSFDLGSHFTIWKKLIKFNSRRIGKDEVGRTVHFTRHNPLRPLEFAVNVLL